MENRVYSNIYYFSHINDIGGIETFFYYLSKKYFDRDITIFYDTGSPTQIERLRKYVRVKQYKGERIKCKKAFFNYNLDIIDNVDADEYIQVAHGDYKSMGIKPNTHPKITKYLGVSKQVCDTYKEVTGFDTELCYNPVVIDEPREALLFVSATRLTKEKGRERMVKFGEIFNNARIPYIWMVFTDSKNLIINSNIGFFPPRLNILDYIKKADYLIQLSDNEGFCISVIESLMIGTPVIVTDCPVFRELGVINGVNGFILDFDLKNIPIEDICKGLKGKFKYEPPTDRWDEYLTEDKSVYDDERREMSRMFEVKALEGFKEVINVDLGRPMVEGEVWIVSKERLEQFKAYEEQNNTKLVEVLREVIDDVNNIEEEPVFVETYDEEPVIEEETTPVKKTSKNGNSKKKTK